MRTREECIAHAERCEAQAKKFQDDTVRSLFGQIAESWRTLAEAAATRADRGAQLTGICAEAVLDGEAPL